MNNIEKYKGLYNEHIENVSDKYIFIERLETRSKRFNWNIKAHIHPGIYQIFLLETGKFTLQSSNKNQEIKSPCLLLIPSAIVHGFRFSDNSSGVIISVANSIIDSITNTGEALIPLFSDLRVLSLENKSTKQKRILQTIEQITAELNNDFREKHFMVNTLLNQLFISIYRLYTDENNANKNNSDYRTLRYFREFKSIIRNADNKTTVVKVAKQIGITPVHLNRICNEVAEKSAGRLITQQVITRAKNYLIYTSHSVSEIAYSLNFEYPNYFSRMFKKSEGLSPSEFRGMN